jgi:hypothetical protein
MHLRKVACDQSPLGNVEVERTNITPHHLGIIVRIALAGPLAEISRG